MSGLEIVYEGQQELLRHGQLHLHAGQCLGHLQARHHHRHGAAARAGPRPRCHRHRERGSHRRSDGQGHRRALHRRPYRRALARRRRSASITDPPAKAGPAFFLHFTARPGFAGTAVVTYTLSNAFSTSPPATVTITVIRRADPSKDADVLGLLSAQLDAAKRFSAGQIANIDERLEDAA